MVNIVKIEEYGNPSNVFNFPYNPQTVSDGISPNDDYRAIPFSNFHIIIGNGTIQPKQISMAGHFTGSNKQTQLEELAYMMKNNYLLKVYFQDDRFQICKGMPLDSNRTNTRTNFIEYSIDFIAAVSTVFSNTQKEASVDSSNNWTNGNLTNGGYDNTYIEEVQITLGTGNNIDDTIIISSNNSVNDSGITYTLGKTYSSGETITVKLVRYFKTNRLYSTEYYLGFDESNDELKSKIAPNKDVQELILLKGERVDNYTIGGTANISNATFKFRDGYSFI